MNTPSLDDQLDLLEVQIKDAGAGLMEGNPQLLQSTATKLLQLVVEFMHLADAVGRTQLKSANRTRRIRAIASSMAVLRENLLRQSAYVDRALGLLVPTVKEKATYAVGGGAFNRQVRQSGAFTVLSA